MMIMMLSVIGYVVWGYNERIDGGVISYILLYLGGIAGWIIAVPVTGLVRGLLFYAGWNVWKLLAKLRFRSLSRTLEKPLINEQAKLHVIDQITKLSEYKYSKDDRLPLDRIAPNILKAASGPGELQTYALHLLLCRAAYSKGTEEVFLVHLDSFDKKDHQHLMFWFLDRPISKDDPEWDRVTDVAGYLIRESNSIISSGDYCARKLAEGARNSDPWRKLVRENPDIFDQVSTNKLTDEQKTLLADLRRGA